MPGVTTPSAHGRVTNPNAKRFDMVELRIHKVHCVKTTKEIDRDEIFLAGIMSEGVVEVSGNKKKLKAKAKKGALLDVGKFKKGETRTYRNPEVVARFKAGDVSMDWPRYYYATLLMIEKDEGALGAVVNAAVKSIDKELAIAVASAAGGLVAGALGGAAAGSVVPLIGTAVGAAAGTAVAAAAGVIKRSRRDDVFDPEQAHLKLKRFPSKAGEVEGSREVETFRGHKGIYKVTYSWAVR